MNCIAPLLKSVWFEPEEESIRALTREISQHAWTSSFSSDKLQKPVGINHLVLVPLPNSLSPYKSIQALREAIF